jgi:L-seryl-tRNA(Ser) seleniumtransferase
MIATPVEEPSRRAEALVARLGEAVEAIEVRSTVGGGSLPGETLPSVGLAVRAASATRTLAALRRGTPAVVGRIEDDRVILDLRTVPPEADGRLEDALRTVLR